MTAILPRGKRAVAEPVFAGWFAQNGNGEMTGTTWIEESGFLEGPVMITNTHSVGVVRDALIAWEIKHNAKFQPWSLLVVAETYDGYLNDTDGFHVKPDHAWSALDSAQSAAVAEGNVGGGTGMVCFGYKGGIGTASRHLPSEQGGYTIGVLVQCNTGARQQLRVDGELVGPEVAELAPKIASTAPGAGGSQAERGSIIIIIATDAPLLPHQLKRIARRATMGLARDGAVSSNSSGDIFLAFSTANPGAAADSMAATHLRSLQAAQQASRWSITTRSRRSSKPLCRRPKRLLSTRCLQPRICGAEMIISFPRFPMRRCARYSENTIV